MQFNQFYYQERTKIQDFYYSFYKKNGKGSHIFSFVDDDTLHYFSRYYLMREYFRCLHPFQFVSEGDCVISVGFHDQYMYLGISHPLILSALVGNTGHVYAIDPDPVNTQALSDYIAANQIQNMTVIQKGVWKNKQQLEFCFFRDYTSSNMPRDLLDQQRVGLNKRWNEERIESQSYSLMVDVDTLDSILKDIPQKVDLINLTVNGAENDIMLGMSKLLTQSPPPKICFPMRDLASHAQGLDILAPHNYALAVANAQHRPWEEEEFNFACALTQLKQLQNLDFYSIEPQQGQVFAQAGTTNLAFAPSLKTESINS